MNLLENVAIAFRGLTANALLEDAALCRAAGMNDFLSKAIDRKALYRMIARWARPGVRQEDAAGLLNAMFCYQLGINLWVGALLSLIFCLGVGFLNGYLVMRTGIPSFSTTCIGPPLSSPTSARAASS